MQLNKKVRPSRIEPYHDEHIEDETTHLWAISYSDFLMVLLSFFILFFSVNQEDKDTIINKIIDVTNNSYQNGTTGSGSGRGPSAVKDHTKAGKLADTDSLVEDLGQNFKILKISRDAKKKSIEVSFPENIYSKYAVTMGTHYENSLKSLLTKLKPFENEIDLYFIGHTDSLAVIQSSDRSLVNNYDLSAIRASRAIQVALELGWNEESLFSLGASKNSKNSRTLSLLIKSKGDAL